MKRPTYRCEDEKYTELQHKLLDDNMTYQDFADMCVDQYLKGKIKKESGEVKKTITSFADFQKFIAKEMYNNNPDENYNILDTTQGYWQNWFEDQQASFDYLEANDSFEITYNGEEIKAEWE